MSVDAEESDEGYVRKKRAPPDAEVDITPMIDLTFQLLIFFMVTSTMQGNPPADLPPSMSGGSIETAKVIDVVVRPADVSGEAPQVEINKEAVNLAELQLFLEEQAGARSSGIDVMILADRTMTNGDVNEVELLISDIPGVTYHFGVQDRREK
ncbi:MAG TPA: biopolymer transporter ExbD [Planctomycetaceae bacterium]|mgnify:FL=1|nr:biopolymer transporter ExbD [Planctomycetaceae bacterium]